ncbi:MAG: glycosyltransferase family 2 protein [Boseongicola sp.]|nr:glycosyltransferase family 2 protein [Boseongicola sp.]
MDVPFDGAADVPLVSVFHLAYNQIDGLREAVEATLEQDNPNLEIVFSDDHSTDGTFEALNEIVAAYDGPHDVRVYRNDENLGIVGNFNTAIERTSGQLIVQCNGDDISRPDRVSRLVEMWQSAPDVLLVHSTAQYLMRDGTEGRHLNVRPPHEFANSPHVYVVDLYYALGASAAYDRRIFDFFGPVPNAAIVEDSVMPFRARLLGQVLKSEEILVQLPPGGMSYVEEGELPGEFRCMLNEIHYGNAKSFLADLRKVQVPGQRRLVMICMLLLVRNYMLKAGFEPALTATKPMLRAHVVPVLKRLLPR